MLFLSLIYLTFTMLGMPGALLGASWPIMHTALGVPLSSAGLISVITTGGTIVSSLFSHRVIRRFGTGRVTMVSVALMAAALLLTAMSPSIIWLMLFAIPLGLGVGAIDAGLNVYVAEHYQARHMNWLHCFWGVGAMLGPLLVSRLSAGGHPWQTPYYTVALMQFGVAIILFFTLPEWKRREDVQRLGEAALPEKQERKSSLSIIKSKKAKLSLLAFFLFTAIEASMMLWGASYLVEVKLTNAQTAAGWVSLLFFGITAGRLLSGFASIKLSNESILRFAGILVLVGFVLLLLPLWPWLTITALMIIGLGLAPIFPVMIHETPHNFGQEDAQAAIGLQMAFAYTGSTFMPPLLGYLYAAISFVWMPVILLVFAAGMYSCIHLLFRMRKVNVQ